MGKVVFLDIDGTIRDFDGYIPETTIESIKRARERGHAIYICTGRPLCQVEKRIVEIGFDGVISGSGSYVLHRDKCIRHKCFSLLNYIRFCEYLLQHECIVELQTYKESYILESDEVRFQQMVKDMQERLGEKSEPLTDYPKVLSSYMDIGEVEKILYFSDVLSGDKIHRDWGQCLYIVPLCLPNSKRWGGEVTPHAVTKAEGIKSILAAGNYSIEDTIAVGDSLNDKEMLELVNVGVAMGNAVSDIKQNADIVTDSLRDHGIQKAFQRFGLI